MNTLNGCNAFAFYAGLSISHVRRPGLSNLALGLARKALKKSPGLVYPYLSNQWS